jgi:hypothetical protein
MKIPVRSAIQLFFPVSDTFITFLILRVTSRIFCTEIASVASLGDFVKSMAVGSAAVTSLAIDSYNVFLRLSPDNSFCHIGRGEVMLSNPKRR